MKDESGWFVLTGRPCSGISTTARALRNLGFRIVPEAARTVIDEGIASGRTVAEIRADDAWFQKEIVRRKLDVERTLARHGGPAFFDRALPDSIAYFEVAGLDSNEVRALCRPDAYQRVFFLEPLPFQADYARTEDMRTLELLERRLYEVYVEIGCGVVRIRAGSVESRVDRIQNDITRS